MPKQYFEDFEVGDTSESSVGRTMSEHDVYTAAGLAGSYGELHTNREAMAQTEYGDVIAQGVLLVMQMDGFGKRLSWEPETVAFYGMDGVRFINPVFIGDTIHMTAEVIDKEVRNDDHGLVTFKEDLVKSDDSVACTRERHLLVERE